MAASTNVHAAKTNPLAVKKRVPGIDKGKIWIADDFDKMSKRELEEWHASDAKLLVAGRRRTTT